MIKSQSSINKAIGNGHQSTSSDIVKTRKNLEHLELYEGDTELEFFDHNLDQAIRKFQRHEGLHEDGLMLPGGETERALNRNLRGDKNTFGKHPPRLRIFSNVGVEETNQHEDVKQLQRSLGMLGLIPSSRGFEPNGIIDHYTNNGIRRFQKENNLRVDGKLLPRGETETAINRALRMAVSDKDKEGEIKGEELPPPDQSQQNIPGTDIPDRGIPEQGIPGSRVYDPYRDQTPSDADPYFVIKPQKTDEGIVIWQYPDDVKIEIPSEWDI